MMLEEKFKFGIIEKNLGFTKDKDVQGRVNANELSSYEHIIFTHNIRSIQHGPNRNGHGQVNADEGTIS